MAAAWREGLARLGAKVGFETLPLVAFPSSGRSGADIPPDGEMDGRPVPMAAILDETSLLLALTEYSLTAALCDVCKRRPGAHVFRAASMPGVQKWMEETSLAADYTEVARRCRLLRQAFLSADHAEVEFSTGHRCLFDLRHRVSETDDGYLHRDKDDDLPVINLPSGETFEVPYEGEIEGDESRTHGELPVQEGRRRSCFASRPTGSSRSSDPAPRRSVSDVLSRRSHAREHRRDGLRVQRSGQGDGQRPRR
jgi:hypothetical protein